MLYVFVTYHVYVWCACSMKDNLHLLNDLHAGRNVLTTEDGLTLRRGFKSLQRIFQAADAVCFPV